MKRLFSIELKKAFFSKTFLLGIGILLVLAIASALYMVINWGNYNPNYLYDYAMKNGSYNFNPDFPIYSVFSAWIGGETLSLSYSLFYFLMPVCAALPYAWSFYLERKHGYIRNIAVRVNKLTYYVAKMNAIFISGAFVVFIPFIVNLMIVYAFIPYYKPWQGYNMYNLVFFGNLWSDLFFEFPFVHTLLFIFLNTLYGGIFALLSSAISFFTQNLFVILFSPFLLMVLGGYIESYFYANFFQKSLVPLEFIPAYFLHSRSIHFQVSSKVVLSITLGLLIVSIGTIVFKGSKDEIY